MALVSVLPLLFREENGVHGSSIETLFFAEYFVDFLPLYVRNMFPNGIKRHSLHGYITDLMMVQSARK